jgi:aryl-alcohol dehydrogenase-like predicted oxidoreductase
MTLSTFYTLGGSGLRITRLALGAMTFGDGSGWSNDETTSRALFDRYVEAGGNLIDTADVYTAGVSEIQLGKFVKDAGLRDKLVIATKYTHNPQSGNPNAVGNSRKNMMRAVEASLRRLDTDYIDLYQMHLWDQVTRPEEVLRAFDDLVSSGKVRYIGLSDIPAWYASRMQTLAEVRGLEQLCCLQMEYSLLERNVEHEFVRLGIDYGMGLLVWSPLASGLLSGKYDAAGIQGRLTQMGGMFDKRSHERTTAIVAELRSVAQELDRSLAQVAINWVANRPGVGSVILGATKVAQLDDTLQALDFEIPAALQQRLDTISAPQARHPYNMFSGGVARMANGNCDVRDKPERYGPQIAPSADKPGKQKN